MTIERACVRKWSHMRSVPEHFIGNHEASLLGSLALLSDPATDGGRLQADRICQIIPPRFPDLRPRPRLDPTEGGSAG